MISSIPMRRKSPKQYRESVMEICPDVRPEGVSTGTLQ